MTFKAPSKKSVKRLADNGLRLEFSNATTLRRNLTEARNTLAKDAEKFGFGSDNYRRSLDKSLGVFQTKAQANFNIVGAIKMGLSDGKTLAAEMITGGRSDRNNYVANLLQWEPLLPLAAISARDSEFANLISALTQETKELHLRKIQQGLALGMSTQELSAQLLGTGLSGFHGRDGIWRKATQRAETIARTVSNDLINYGAHLTYVQMDEITPEAGFEKVWQTVSDNRTSDICESLAGQRKPLDAVFVGNGWSGQRPPSHPNCRSRITMVARRYEANWDLRYAA